MAYKKAFAVDRLVGVAATEIISNPAALSRECGCLRLISVPGVGD